MTDGPEPRTGRTTDLGGGVAIKVAAWFLSVAVLNFLVGSPVTDLYVGASIVAMAFWIGWKASTYFEEPPGHGAVALTDAEERRYRGAVSREGDIRFLGPDGREWSGSAWAGSWTVEDPDGGAWHGRVGRKGDVLLSDEGGRELRGTLTP